MTTTKPERKNFAIVTVILPGPDRKRSPAPYQYHVTFRNPEPAEPGCVMTWLVTGGREEYQVACERTADDRLEWHCTCPDAVYHGTYRHAYCCKHVQGIRALIKSASAPLPQAA
jgi:hypothetical protein